MGDVQVFTQKIWLEGKDKFVATTATLAFLKKQSSDAEYDSWTKIKVNDNVYLLELDLLQWMHLTRDQRCELLIDYARRPHKESNDPTKKDQIELKNLVQLHAMTVSDHGGVWHYDGKIVDVPADTEMYLVAWKSPKTAVVQIGIDSEERIEISHLHLVERGHQWIDMIDKASSLYGVNYCPLNQRMSEIYAQH